MIEARSDVRGIDDLDAAWTPWSPEDRPLYERFFSAWNHGSYEANFAYVQQECRERAWKHVGDEVLITACARGSRSEFAFVLPPAGPVENAARVLPGLCRRLAAATGRRVVLRKLPDALYASLLGNGAFAPVPLETYRNPRELPEDIHPQVVAPTRRKDAYDGSDFVKTRNHVRTAHRRHDIGFRNLGPSNEVEVVAMIEGWARDHNARLHDSPSPGQTPIDALGVDPAAYTVFCRRFSTLVDDSRYFGRVMVMDGEVVAIAFAGRTSETSAALYASICRVRSRGVSECMVVDMLDLLALHGVATLNFGGSEGLDLFRYKDKWRTSALVNTRELEFISKNNPLPRPVGQP